MTNTESFSDYLDRVGTDFNNSGFEATAHDYFTAAARISRTIDQLIELSEKVNDIPYNKAGEVVVEIEAIVQELNNPIPELRE